MYCNKNKNNSIMKISQRTYRANKLGYGKSTSALIPISEISTNSRDLFMDEVVIGSVSVDGNRVGGYIKNGSSNSLQPSSFILPIHIFSQAIQNKCIDRLEEKLDTAI